MIPSEKELVEFIRKRDLVNFSLIAKFFDIKNATVSDLVLPLQKKKLIEIKKLGGSKVVRLRKKK
tara:strand:+ start:39991 stop:40185 length:195 start_codon:yes stop_codon:yes gene_type:complete